jgi:chromosome segregation ATPase
VKDIHEKFAVIEERVRALRAENDHLASRVSDLEEELAQARRAAQELEQFRGRKLHIRERIENILRTLESIGGKKHE